jgi:MFS family permease
MPRALNPASPGFLVTVLCLAEIAGMAGFAIFWGLLPIFINEWGLTNTEAGAINGILFFGYVAAVPVLVSLTDRMDPKRIYIFSMTLTGLSSLGFAFMAGGFWSASFFRLIAGIGLAGTYMPGLKALSDRLEGRTQSRAIAFYTGGFSIGSALSFFLAGELAAALGWQWTFALAALGPLAAVALVFFVLPPAEERNPDAPSTHLLDFRPVLRSRAAMGYVFAYAGHSWEVFAYRSWIVAFLVYAAAVHPHPGGAVLSATVIAMIVNLLGVPASILGNELATRFNRRRVISVIMVFSALIAFSIGHAAALPYWLVAVLSVIYGMAIMGDSASLTAGVLREAPTGYRGATMAVYSCIGFFGAFLGPLVFGLALDLTGGGRTIASWSAGFITVGAVVLLGPVALNMMGSQKKRRG